MNIALAQIKLRCADFKYNIKNIISKIETTECDTIIFPQADISRLGGKDLSNDDVCNIEQINFYETIAGMGFKKAIFIGDVLINNGEIVKSDDGFYKIDDKTIYVSEIYDENIDCDLYILAQNRYFTIGQYSEFIDSIDPNHDFVYINPICMADENIYGGRSFAKNKNGRLCVQMPLCEEKVQKVDFAIFSPIQEYLPEEEMLKVTVFALKEYCEITGLKRVVLGLSGGIDSALTAALAARAIGPENVLGILMPSMFSSQGSIDDSLKLAQNLGIKTEKHSIVPLFDVFMEKIAHETLDTSGKENLAVENLQARLRAVILMYFSNRDNRLLLSTGNKSEAAMGYGTLYGDMAGGLNLIADMTKTNVYKLSNYINKDSEIIPQETIDKAPSAELRPNQKDQDSLPEYEVLDDIIEMYIEKGMSQDEIYEKYDKNLVDDVIKRIYRNQFKRYQACLGVRLTEKAFFNGVDLPILQNLY